ncbi:hypothetical protein Y032_0031g2404 [Ancylostoma ceylanicum]|uniref:Uncharacterized protein n=1 Tax=Ancylostoma ceylanicum TaxID=53326 RepID=A0A016UR63_9BILA|nr:hypothetical protein Y032_0031g2404 [Ancylostoma ceylanicum]
MARNISLNLSILVMFDYVCSAPFRLVDEILNQGWHHVLTEVTDILPDASGNPPMYNLPQTPPILRCSSTLLYDTLDK